MLVLGQTCNDKCAAYDTCVQAGTADCSSQETQCGTCMNSEQQGFNQPAQSYGQLAGALADPWRGIPAKPRSVFGWRDFPEPRPAPVVRGVRIRMSAERFNRWWYSMSPAERDCSEYTSAELQARISAAMGMLDDDNLQGYINAVNAASADFRRKVRHCDQAHVAGMAIPFVGETKTFTGKDWTMLIGALVLVVVLVYVLWAHRR